MGDAAEAATLLAAALAAAASAGDAARSAADAARAAAAAADAATARVEELLARMRSDAPVPLREAAAVPTRRLPRRIFILRHGQSQARGIALASCGVAP
jgi:hypothetical protein